MATRWGDERFLEAWGQGWSAGDPDQVLPLYAADAHYRDDGSQLDFHGRDEIERFYRFMLVFSPDTVVRFHEAHGDDAGFAATWTWSGTATGTLQVGDERFKVDGRPFSVPGVAFCRLSEDGLIASHVDYYDMHAVIRAVTA